MLGELAPAKASGLMAAGREIECRQVWGEKERVEQELGGLKALFASQGPNSQLTLS